MTDPGSPRDRYERQGQEKWYDRTLYQLLLLLGGTALFVLGLGLILDWYIAPQSSTQKKDLVQALGFITAGVAGAAGILFTWRGQRLAREAQEETRKSTQEQLELARQSQAQNQKATQAQLDNAQEEQRLVRQGQITERFNRALDQLGQTDAEGNPRFGMRLGAIYALERIARDSPERDYAMVMEVLASYVRENAPWPPKKDATPTSASSGAATPNETAEKTTALHPEPVRVDVQASLNVLGRRDDSVSNTARLRLDLRNTNLSRIELFEADLSNASFHNADLSNATIVKADLSGADFLGADLYGAKLVGADLSGADFLGAHLHGTWLYRAKLEGVTNLTQEQLNWTIADAATTQPPEGLDPPASWSKGHEEQTNTIIERLTELQTTGRPQNSSTSPDE